MPLSQLAGQLLRSHAQRPKEIFYNPAALSSMLHDSDLAAIDHAYLELANARLMEPAGIVISFFGAPKSLYRITQNGIQRAAQQPAA